LYLWFDVSCYYMSVFGLNWCWQNVADRFLQQSFPTVWSWDSARRHVWSVPTCLQAETAAETASCWSQQQTQEGWNLCRCSWLQSQGSPCSLAPEWQHFRPRGNELSLHIPLERLVLGSIRNLFDFAGTDMKIVTVDFFCLSWCIHLIGCCMPILETISIWQHREFFGRGSKLKRTVMLDFYFHQSWLKHLIACFTLIPYVAVFVLHRRRDVFVAIFLHDINVLSLWMIFWMVQTPSPESWSSIIAVFWS